MPHNVRKNRGKQPTNVLESLKGNDKPKERAALYVRASSFGQVDGQEITTLDAQLSACRNFAQSRGWEVIIEADETRSGRSLKKRPELLNILSAIDRGEIKHLVVKNITRLSRSVSDYSSIVDRVSIAGGDIWLVDQPELNTGNASGDLMRNMLAAFSQFESQMISERVRSKNLHYFELGLPVGQAPDGYKWCKDGSHTWIVDDERAQVVRTIFEKYIELKSVPGLLQWLKDNGYKSATGKKLISSTVHKMLTNRAYIGECYWESQGWYEGKHKALITRQQFDDTQALLERNKRSVGNSRRHEYMFILPDRIYGEGVDAEGNKVWLPLTPDWTEKKQKNGSKRRHFYYRSKAHRRKINNSKCKPVVPNLPADILEDRVMQAIEDKYSSVVLDNGFFADIRKSTEKSAGKTKSRLRSIESKIRSRKEEIQVLIRRLGDPELEFTKEVLSAVNDNVRKINDEIANLEDEREHCSNLLTVYENTDSNIEYFKDLLRRLHRAHNVTDRKALKDILAILISRVNISNEELQVEIRVIPQLKDHSKPWLGGDTQKLGT